MSAQSAGDYAVAMNKLQTVVPPMRFDSLPSDRNDKAWDDVRAEYKLSLPELCAVKNARCSATGAVEPLTPGESDIIFLVLEITLSEGRIETAIPIQIAFAFTEGLLLTAAHGVCTEDGQQVKQLAVLQEYSEPVVATNLIPVAIERCCTDECEDWAVLRRITGKFPHWADICPETDLPPKGGRIGIKGFPVGLVSSNPLSTVRTKVYHYEHFRSDTEVHRLSGTKRSFAVVYDKPPELVENSIVVAGGRVTRGSCGAAYFSEQGKVIAFHVRSAPDDYEESSAWGNSHNSKSVGVVLYRLPKFMEWFTNRASLEHSASGTVSDTPPVVRRRRSVVATLGYVGPMNINCNVKVVREKEKSTNATHSS